MSSVSSHQQQSHVNNNNNDGVGGGDVLSEEEFTTVQTPRQQQNETDNNNNNLDFLNVYEPFYIATESKDRYIQENSLGGYEPDIHKKDEATNPYLKSALHVYKAPFQILKQFDSKYKPIPYKQMTRLNTSQNQIFGSRNDLLSDNNDLESDTASTATNSANTPHSASTPTADNNNQHIEITSNLTINTSTTTTTTIQQPLPQIHIGDSRPPSNGNLSLTLSSLLNERRGSNSDDAPTTPLSTGGSSFSDSNSLSSPQSDVFSTSPNSKKPLLRANGLFEKLNKIAEDKRRASDVNSMKGDLEQQVRRNPKARKSIFQRKVHMAQSPETAEQERKDLDKRHEQRHLVDRVKALCNEKTAEQIDIILKKKVISRHEQFDIDFKATNRLLSCFQPNYSWTPLEETKCHRARNQQYPIRKKTKFVLEAKSLSFDFGIAEPLFCRVALYDLQNKDKLTEDYHFHLNSQESLSQLSETVRRELSASINKCIMSVTYPNPEIYLVLFVDKVLTGTVDDAIKPYQKELSEKERAKIFEANVKSVEKFERFRQPFLWGSAPIFDTKSQIPDDPSIQGPAMVQLRRDLIEVKPLYKLIGDSKELFNIYEEIPAARAGKLKSSIGACAQFNISVLSHIRAAQRSSNADEVPQIGISSVETPTDTVTTDEPHHQSSSYNDTNLTPGSFPTSSSLDRATVLQGRRSNADVDTGSDATEPEQAPPSQQIPYAEEIPITGTRFPHTLVKNVVYVRPVCGNLAIGKAKNIGVQVLLRDDDLNTDNISGRPFICSKYGRKLVDHAMLGVVQGERNPQYFDEVKIELPVPVHSKYHLLFIFYELQTEKKANKVKQAKGGDTAQERFGKAEKVVIGYSFLPLVAPENQMDGTVPYLIDSDEYRIDVYKSLSSLYLSADKLESHGSKVKFRVEVRTKSTIYPADDIIKRIYYYTSQIQQTYEHKRENIDLLMLALNDIRNVRIPQLMPFLPVLLNMIFEILGTAYSIANDLLLGQAIERAAFESVLTILRHVFLTTEMNQNTTATTTQDTRLNRFLSTFVTHIFENSEEAIPLYAPLMRLLADSITRYQDPADSYEASSPTVPVAPRPERQKKQIFGTIRKRSVKDPLVTEVSPARPFSERDVLRFNWFFFDLVIKSLVLHHQSNRDEDETEKQKQHAVDELGWTVPDEIATNEESFANLFTHCRNTVREMVKAITRLLPSSNAKHAYIAVAANRNLALFLSDLIPILSRCHIVELIQEYNNNLQGLDPRFIEIKLEFFSIIFDSDNFLALNNLELSQGNKVISLFVDTFFEIGQLSNDKLAHVLDRACKLIMQFFTKLDYDSRLQSKSSRHIVTEMFMPFIERVFSSTEFLDNIQNDGQLTAIVVTVLWLLRNMHAETLLNWWKKQEIYLLLNMVSFLEQCTATFFAYELERGSNRASDATRHALSSINYLISLITNKEALDTILDSLRHLDPFMSQSFGTNVPTEQQKFVQRQIQLEEEFETTKTTQSPYVGLLMRRLSRLLMNASFFSCLHDDREISFMFFHSCLKPFLENYARELVVKELYNAKQQKKCKINAIEKSRIEQKWRWLMGIVLANLVLEMDSSVNSVILDCYKALVEPFLDPTLMEGFTSTASTIAEPPVQQEEQPQEEPTNVEESEQVLEEETNTAITTDVPVTAEEPEPLVVEENVDNVVIQSLEESSALDSVVSTPTDEPRTPSTPISPIPPPPPPRNQDDEDIVFTEDNLVRAATLDKLIEVLVGASKYLNKEGQKFKKIFLLTYYSFTTPAELITKVTNLYPNCEDKSQLNILNFLSDWVKKGFHDFDNIVIARLIQFLSSLGQERNTTKNKLKKIILKQLLESKTTISTYQHSTMSDANAPKVPNGFSIEANRVPKIDLKTWRSLKKKTLPNPFDFAFDILEWPSIEIARQLTLIESELFKRIEPKECFGLGWSKANKEDLSPNIVAITERFNKMSFWIRNMFVNERDLKRRQQMLLKFLDIIKELRELKNYTSIFQITSAVNSAEVHRLRQTRDVLSDKQEELYKEASSIFENNYSGLRNELKYAAGSPTVPFQGVYLTDLTFIEDGNQNFLTYNSKELINFTKRRYYSTTIGDIQLLQQASHYDIQPLPYLQYILTEDIFTNLVEDEKVLYQKSLQREARK